MKKFSTGFSLGLGLGLGLAAAALLLSVVLPTAPRSGPERSGPERNGSGHDGFVLRVRDWKTGAVYVELPAKEGGGLFFGWIHSLEKIPWNEYYHIDGEGRLILDAITFPAFGAGIPEDKGRVCYVKDGLIHMEEIDQVFEELVWLNSHTATQDIRLDGELVARGDSLPQHTRVRLTVERNVPD